MKNILSISVLALLLLFSCKKEGIYTKPNPEKLNLQDTVTVLKSGNFYPTSGISVNGYAEIKKQNTTSYVKLANFTVTSGPDLKVYLSKKDVPFEFINLGALSSTQLYYQIPSGIKVEDYSHVLIHCQQYNHLFAIAKLY